jgi:hypothetical protein
MSARPIAFKAPRAIKIQAYLALQYLDPENRRSTFKDEVQEVEEDDLRRDGFNLGSKELLIRMAMSTLANYVVQTYLIAMLPFVLASTESMIDFVKDALSLVFIVGLDDIKEEKIETRDSWRDQWTAKKETASKEGRDASVSMSFITRPHLTAASMAPARMLGGEFTKPVSAGLVDYFASHSPSARRKGLQTIPENSNRDLV